VYRLRVFRIIRYHNMLYWITVAAIGILLLNSFNQIIVLYRFYNKNLYYISKEFLSDNTISMIVLLVSGDKFYLNNYLKKSFTENQIIHLLVLSGSNLIILIQFLTLLIDKERFSFLVIKYIILLSYLAFTSYPHPLARAFIYMSFADLISFNGFKSCRTRYFAILVFFSFLLGFYLGYSMSFLLSSIYSLSILLFNIFTNIKRRFIRFLVFNCYISLVTSLVCSLFNLKNDFTRTFISSFIITPFFDFYVYQAYVSYLIIPLLVNLNLSYIIKLIDTSFGYLFTYLDFITLNL